MDSLQLPFIFARVDNPEEACKGGTLIVKDWVVIIADFWDMSVYESAWMGDPELGNILLQPSLDIFTNKYTFNTFHEARKFVRDWYINNKDI